MKKKNSAKKLQKKYCKNFSPIIVFEKKKFEAFLAFPLLLKNALHYYYYPPPRI